jgi:hypothetical protein
LRPEPAIKPTRYCSFACAGNKLSSETISVSSLIGYDLCYFYFCDGPARYLNGG